MEHEDRNAAHADRSLDGNAAPVQVEHSANDDGVWNQPHIWVSVVGSLGYQAPSAV